jgi:hypothetical protein
VNRDTRQPVGAGRCDKQKPCEDFAMPSVEDVRTAFEFDRVLFSQHARHEMRDEPLGRIRERDVAEAVATAEQIDDYPDDEAYPSSLFLGWTSAGRPLHLVISYDEEAGLAIVVTVYEPNPRLWIESRERKR